MFKKNNKGQVAFFLLFLFIATVMVILTAVAAPFGSKLATEFYSAGEDLLISGQETAAEIQDPEVAATLNASFQTAINSATTNIQVSNGLYQYGWVFVLVLVVIVLYLVTRQTVAFQRIV